VLSSVLACCLQYVFADEDYLGPVSVTQGKLLKSCHMARVRFKQPSFLS